MHRVEMTKTFVEPKEIFRKTLVRLIEIVLLGKAHLRIGRGIADVVAGDPVVATVAPVFWGMTITAHLDIALAAFKLFDTHRGTMTIEYLLDKAQKCSSSFQKATPSRVSAIVTLS